MAISYDPAKNERNDRERGLSFDRAADFDFDTALIKTEVRGGETRQVVIGSLDKRLHLLCYLLKFGRDSRDQLPQDKRERGKAVWQNANR
jgi:hypothetical protein